jgi:hypothetical protein
MRTKRDPLKELILRLGINPEEAFQSKKILEFLTWDDLYSIWFSTNPDFEIQFLDEINENSLEIMGILKRPRGIDPILLKSKKNPHLKPQKTLQFSLEYIKSALEGFILQKKDWMTTLKKKKEEFLIKKAEISDKASTKSTASTANTNTSTNKSGVKSFWKSFILGDKVRIYNHSDYRKMFPLRGKAPTTLKAFCPKVSLKECKEMWKREKRDCIGQSKISGEQQNSYLVRKSLPIFCLLMSQVL